MAPFDRPYMTFYWSAIVKFTKTVRRDRAIFDIALSRTVLVVI